MCMSGQFSKLGITLLLLSSTISILAISNIPKPFQGQNKNSNIVISYDDFSHVLKMSVLDVGPSNRKKSPKLTGKIGSRYKSKRKAYTDLEGNRFLFGNFKIENNKTLITSIRKSLEKVPDEVPMSMLNAKEQLAFWLNLYNISLIEQLIDVFPAKNIEDELYDDDGIMAKKFLKVSGVELSLNDIHEKIIIGKFHENPIVMYGLFQGVIGGPNIRTTAYDGVNVINQLKHNAREFINSNRGTFKSKKDKMRVSSFYDRNRQFFPDFDRDLKKHLLYYMHSKYASHLENSDIMLADIKNMGIADIAGGIRNSSSSANDNPAAFLGSVHVPSITTPVLGEEGYVHMSGHRSNRLANDSGFAKSQAGLRYGYGENNQNRVGDSLANDLAVEYGRFSPDVVKMLMKLQEKAKMNSGEVIIKPENN